MAVNKVIYYGEVLVDMSQVTVKPEKMLEGETALDAAGELIEGAIPSQAAQTITPGTADQSIAAGKYLTGEQTIKGDANLLPANIKSGVNIFGVAGTLEEGSGGGGATVETCTVTITVESESPEDITVYVTYVDVNSGTAVVEEVTAPALDVATKTISVAKNSLISLDRVGLIVNANSGSMPTNNMQIVRSFLSSSTITNTSTRGVVLQVTGDGATLGYFA